MTEFIPRDISRPVLVYYVGKFGDSIRIIYPDNTKPSDFLSIQVDHDFGFAPSYEQNDWVIFSINYIHEILHWEYL